MKRPFLAAEAAAFSTFVVTPDLEPALARAFETIHTTARSGLYGCVITIQSDTLRPLVQTFLVRLGYHAVITGPTVSVYWTTLRQ